MIPLTLDEIVTALEGRPNRKMTPVTVTGVSTDSRTCPSGALFFALRGETHDGHEFVEAALQRGAAAAVVDRTDLAVDGPLIRVSDTVGALGKLASFHRRQRSIPVIAVTGSNGKTTVKCMIHHVLSQRLTGKAAPKSYNNAIGVPLTLLSADAQDQYVVLEIGSNAPGEVGALAAMASPNIGVITSIGEAHLERFNDVVGVAAEKLALLDHLSPRGIAVVPVDLTENGLFKESGRGRSLVTFGAAVGADVRISDYRGDLEGGSFKINDRYRVQLPVAGRHNAVNAAAAYAVCRRLNLEPEKIVEALATYEPPPMRMNVWRGGGLTVVDDSYNANPSSMAAAIEILSSVGEGRRVLVVGDMLELGGGAAMHHERMGRLAAQSGLELLVAVGEFRDAVIQGTRSAGAATETIGYADTAAACHDLPRQLHDGDTVLVKGSRRLGLDRLADCLRKSLDTVPCL